MNDPRTHAKEDVQDFVDFLQKSHGIRDGMVRLPSHFGHFCKQDKSLKMANFRLQRQSFVRVQR
jgi:hypothetical protein